MSSEDVAKMSRDVKAEIGGTGVLPAADGVGARPPKMDCILWPRCCMKQEGITRVKVRRRVMFDSRALSSGHEVEEVEVEDERSESQEAPRPRRISSPVLPSSDEVDAELENDTLLRKRSLDGNMNGIGLRAEFEASPSTGAVGENILPVLVMKDKRSQTLSVSFMLAEGVDGFAIEFEAAIMH